ncbi:single-pass membrane protein with aspartate-rich tail 1b [Denticeps clupeoides]|uniref:Essential MCU regulator, mitochondrial n=1 Tax=Denticeps clupeoides TaxID=299321 RepID=A0AAY4DQP2_9TELE|nr:essential MCU regulator, mitochondrial-like [Denticeps clupeoides]
MASSVAASLCRLFLRRNTGRLNMASGLSSAGTSRIMVCRNAVSSTSGAILPKPDKVSFGLIRMVVVIVPFLYLGTQISKSFAALLEEHEIFVPSDDDDDD